MRSPNLWKGAGPAALTVTLLAAVLLLAAQDSYAQRGEGRGSQGAWRSTGERSRSGGGDARYKGGGGNRGGDNRGGNPTWNGGGARYKGDGGRVWNGGGNYRGGTSYRGDWRSGGGHRDRGWYGGTRYYRSAPRYYGGSSYYYGSGWYPRSTYYYRYPRPRTYVSIGLGLPYYCPITYRRVVVRHPVVSEYSDEVDVENLPPAGCYYYDPYCQREFTDLDSYTDHVDSESHAQTIEIRERDSGDYVRTLEFSGGYWVVQR